MRNPLKRHAPRNIAKPTLRARLAGAKGKLVAVKEKYGRTLRVHRALNAPLPAAEPTVDRVALVNYATWLFFERRLVCRELYPHMGAKAASFVHANVAADEFHFPSRGKGPVAAPSTRAVATLDALGIDWRRDRDEGGWTDPASDDPAAPLPYGWPALDAELTEALGDLRRLDLAVDALGTYGPGDDRELSDLQAWSDLDSHRDAALDRLASIRAESLTGLQAKARALLTNTVREQGRCSRTGVSIWETIAHSLARDLISARRSVLDRRRPDPILPMIEEAKRLSAVLSATFDEWPHGDRSEPQELRDRRDDATEALWSFVRGTLLKTVPTTAEGCVALARFMLGLLAGSDWSDDAPVILGLIALSPLR